MEIRITVFFNSAKLEIDDFGRTDLIGWFSDEVDAVAAAYEHILIASAIQPDLRRLPELVVSVDYRAEASLKVPVHFIRATRVKPGPCSRRFVMSPGASAKRWVASVLS
jgi:hypothetical protein